MKEQKVYDLLKALSISYDVIEHAPAYTVDQMNDVLPPTDAKVCKNLFLRDQKGKQHYLVIMWNAKPMNLKAFADQQGLGKMSFASEKRLLKYLDVPSGSVSPFSLLNDADAHVIVYIDADLKNQNLVGFHPNINTATVTLSSADFEKYLATLDNEIHWVEITE